MMLSQAGRQCHPRTRRLHVRLRHARRRELEHPPGLEASQRRRLYSP